MNLKSSILVLTQMDRQKHVMECTGFRGNDTGEGPHYQMEKYWINDVSIYLGC